VGTHHMTASLALGVACLAASLPGPALAQGRSSRVSIDVVDAEVREVAESIGRAAGQVIVVDPRVGAHTITVRLSDIEWRHALAIVAEMTDCELELRPNGVAALVRPPRITLSARDANVRTIIMMLARYADVNIVISPEVQGTITLDLRDVDPLAALRAVVRTAGDYALVGDSPSVEARGGGAGGSAEAGAERSDEVQLVIEGTLDSYDEGVLVVRCPDGSLLPVHVGGPQAHLVSGLRPGVGLTVAAIEEDGRRALRGLVVDDR
jgi:hypothetical protein